MWLICGCWKGCHFCFTEVWETLVQLEMKYLVCGTKFGQLRWQWSWQLPKRFQSSTKISQSLRMQLNKPKTVQLDSITRNGISWKMSKEIKEKPFSVIMYKVRFLWMLTTRSLHWSVWFLISKYWTLTGLWHFKWFRHMWEQNYNCNKNRN